MLVPLLFVTNHLFSFFVMPLYSHSFSPSLNFSTTHCLASANCERPVELRREKVGKWGTKPISALLGVLKELALFHVIQSESITLGKLDS